MLAEAAKKAKRSLADSFNIIRRRASVDVSGESSAVPNISVERPTPVKITPSKVNNKKFISYLNYFRTHLN